MLVWHILFKKKKRAIVSSPSEPRHSSEIQLLGESSKTLVRNYKKKKKNENNNKNSDFFRPSISLDYEIYLQFNKLLIEIDFNEISYLFYNFSYDSCPSFWNFKFEFVLWTWVNSKQKLPKFFQNLHTYVIYNFCHTIPIELLISITYFIYYYLYLSLNRFSEHWLTLFSSKIYVYNWKKYYSLPQVAELMILMEKSTRLSFAWLK